MELSEFIATHVTPGQPLTAKAWNDLVTALDAAYKFIRATTHVVKVHINNDDIDNSKVRVVASSVSEAPVEAVRPLDPDGDHILVELSEGQWTVYAEALGFATGQVIVDVVPNEQVHMTELTLDPGQAIMPDVFGLKLTDALALLTDQDISVTQLLDFLGTRIPVEDPTGFTESPVLVQQPAPGQLVDPTKGVGLVIAVAPKIETAIEVPSLVGMTEVEARRVLEQLGLTPGKSVFLEK